MIKTKNLNVRPATVKDAEGLYEVMDSNYDSMFVESIPNTIDDVIAWIREGKPGTTQFLMESDVNKKIIGCITVVVFKSNFACSLGVVIHDEYKNQGLMTEALTGVIDYIFENTDVDYITVNIADSNEVSKRLFYKLGFFQSNPSAVSVRGGIDLSHIYLLRR